MVLNTVPHVVVFFHSLVSLFPSLRVPANTAVTCLFMYRRLTLGDEILQTKHEHANQGYASQEQGPQTQLDDGRRPRMVAILMLNGQQPKHYCRYVNVQAVMQQWSKCSTYTAYGRQSLSGPKHSKITPYKPKRPMVSWYSHETRPFCRSRKKTPTSPADCPTHNIIMELPSARWHVSGPGTTSNRQRLLAAGPFWPSSIAPRTPPQS